MHSKSSPLKFASPLKVAPLRDWHAVHGPQIGYFLQKGGFESKPFAAHFKYNRGNRARGLDFLFAAEQLGPLLDLGRRLRPVKKQAACPGIFRAVAAVNKLGKAGEELSPKTPIVLQQSCSVMLFDLAAVLPAA